MEEFLLQISSEEIPARMQNESDIALGELFVRTCLKHGLVPHDAPGKGGIINLYSSPVRIAISCFFETKISLPQEVIRGPKVSASQAAISGFVKKYSIALEDLDVSGEYYVYTRKSSQTETFNALFDIMTDFLNSAQSIWPASMTWAGGNFRWIRPIRAIACIFGDKIIPLQINAVRAGSIIMGHKFADKMEQCDLLEKFSNGILHGYLKFLEDQNITMNHLALNDLNGNYFLDKKREEKIADFVKSQLLQISSDVETSDVNKYKKIISEVAGLCESPYCILGRIDQKYFNLPQEIIATVMISHQKYIPLYKKDGNLSGYFVIVLDRQLLSDDERESILSGNYKVLRARLEDALFFYNKDLNTAEDLLLGKLQNITFHDKLGSIFDRIEKIKGVYKILAKESNISAAHMENILSKMHYIKIDLATEIVGEFPELQGYVGSEYFAKNISNKELLDAIKLQYRVSPATLETKNLIILAEWLEYGISLIIAGEEPTSSRDPLGIRRRLKSISESCIDVSQSTMQSLVRFLLTINNSSLECEDVARKINRHL